ncbi:ABC transporter permease [Shewanella salipaludis]|uniref:ABC transporter permease n=1 Tax=Shewanella salipaludis TaxID=2723052 RepID=A0A972FQX4_9GAMM|nr:ABC transporter permease [Shewanella salipaludis]NMH64495.1 ABC transporter permease [Shewanella salipaludis]
MGSLSLIFPLAWRNLWRNRRRSLLTMLAIFVAVYSMVTMGAFMRAWSRAAVVETINNLTGHGQIHAPGYLDDPNVDHRISHLPSGVAEILTRPPVSHFARRVRVPAMIRTERESAPVELLGIEPEREQGLSFIPHAVVDGHYFVSADERGILLGEQLAKRLQTRLGRRLVLMSQGADGGIEERGLRIVGIFSSQPDIEKYSVFITLPQAQALLQIGDDFSELVYRLADEQDSGVTAARLAQQAGELEVRAWDELQPFTKALMEMSEGSIWIWILVSFALVSFGLINTLLVAVFERMREFGLLQALGMKPRWLLLQLLIESGLMLGLATLSGLLAGMATVQGFDDGLYLGVGASYFGAAQVVYPRLDWTELRLIGISVMLMGLLASLYPAFKAARQVPVEVLARATN